MDDIIKFLEENYPSGEVRKLDDGSYAILHDLLTTRSVILGADEWTYKRRFCFTQRPLANQFFEALKSEHDVPDGGYVARRPEVEDRADPYLNVLHDRPWNKEFE